MEVAPGWYLFTRGPAENGWHYKIPTWEAGLVAPDRTEHVIRAGSREELARRLSETMESLGVRPVDVGDA